MKTIKDWLSHTKNRMIVYAVIISIQILLIVGMHLKAQQYYAQAREMLIQMYNQPQSSILVREQDKNYG